jgi:hypothetical protein
MDLDQRFREAQGADYPTMDRGGRIASAIVKLIVGVALAMLVFIPFGAFAQEVKGLHGNVICDTPDQVKDFIKRSSENENQAAVPVEGCGVARRLFVESRVLGIYTFNSGTAEIVEYHVFNLPGTTIQYGFANVEKLSQL